MTSFIMGSWANVYILCVYCTLLEAGSVPGLVKHVVQTFMYT